MSNIPGNYAPFVPQIQSPGTQGAQGTEDVSRTSQRSNTPAPPNGTSMLNGDAYVAKGNSAGFNPRVVTEDMHSANRISFNINNVLILIAQTMMESRKDQRAAWVQQAQNILATGEATANQMKQAAAWKLGGAVASAAASAAVAGVSAAMAGASLKANATATAKVDSDLAAAGLKLEKVDSKTIDTAVDADVDVQAQAQKIVADNPGLELSDTPKTDAGTKSTSTSATTESSTAPGAADADQAAVQSQQAETKAKLDDTAKQLDQRSVENSTAEADAQTSEAKATESRDQVKDKQVEVDTKKEALKIVEDNPDLELEASPDKVKSDGDAKAKDGSGKQMTREEKLENNRKYYELKGQLMRQEMSVIDATSTRNNAIASVLKAGVDAMAAGAQNMSDVQNAEVELLRSKRDYQSQLASAQLDFANEARDLLNKTLDMMQSIEAARHKATGAINNV
jgi:hypothetical protein